MNSLAIAAGLAFVSFGSNAIAADVTDGINVSANVVASCTVDASDLGFGAYNPQSGTALDATTSISVICTNDHDYNVAINAGGGASVTAREMSHAVTAANKLNYALFTDSGRTSNWGDTLAGTGTGSAQSLTVYARVAAGQTAALSGNYADTLTVTVTY